MSRLLTSPAAWAGYALQVVVTTQVWVAMQTLLDPGSSFLENLWPFAVGSGVGVTLFTNLVPLLARRALKDDGGLSDEQNAALEQALRTGVLPIVSFFADWGPALKKRRRDLASGRWLTPIIAAGLIALNIHAARLDPKSAWFYWSGALFYSVVSLQWQDNGVRLQAVEFVPSGGGIAGS